MAVSIPHFAFPPQIRSDGHLSVVEQDSHEDILGCVYVALKTDIGSRLYVPEFGVSDYTFNNAPIPRDKLMAEIQTSEPRAIPDIQVEVDELIEKVQVGVGNVG